MTDTKTKKQIQTTLVDIKRELWADVKHYATVHEIKVGQALDQLLQQALEKEGYSY